MVGAATSVRILGACQFVIYYIKGKVKSSQNFYFSETEIRNSWLVEKRYFGRDAGRSVDRGENAGGAATTMRHGMLHDSTGGLSFS